jgi:hypothetical protein
MAERGRPPVGVAERLERLRALYVPESDAEARRRLEIEACASAEPFAVGVARRLEELRALSDLTSHLHRRQGR